MKRPLAHLARLLRSEDREEILGDLEEGFAQRVERKGRPAARWWLWRQVFNIPVRLTTDRALEWVRGRSAPATNPRLALLEECFRDIDQQSSAAVMDFAI